MWSDVDVCCEVIGFEVDCVCSLVVASSAVGSVVLNSVVVPYSVCCVLDASLDCWAVELTVCESELDASCVICRLDPSVLTPS